MDRFTGGCLAATSVRSFSQPYAWGFVTVLTPQTPWSVVSRVGDFSESAVTVTGETRDYNGRCFCPRCGSPVFTRSADEVEVNVGSLDQPDQFKPTYELWTIRRESWLPALPVAHHYERDRESSGRSED